MLPQTRVTNESASESSFQLRKLGRLPPEVELPLTFSRALQAVWADNGDALSKHYTGTAAMKVSQSAPFPLPLFLALVFIRYLVHSPAMSYLHENALFMPLGCVQELPLLHYCSAPSDLFADAHLLGPTSPLHLFRGLLM